MGVCGVRLEVVFAVGVCVGLGWRWCSSWVCVGLGWRWCSLWVCVCGQEVVFAVGVCVRALRGITLSLSMSDPGAQEGVSCAYQYHVRCVLERSMVLGLSIHQESRDSGRAGGDTWM